MPFPLIPLIIAGASAAMQAQGGQKDRRTLQAQGKVARATAGADADAISREYRQLAGRQAAAMAQAGGSYDGSNAKILAQSESLAFLDRLQTLYKGNVRKLGLDVEGDDVRTRAYAGAGTSLLSAFSGGYTAGKTMPGLR